MHILVGQAHCFGRTDNIEIVVYMVYFYFKLRNWAQNQSSFSSTALVLNNFYGTFFIVTAFYNELNTNELSNIIKKVFLHSTKPFYS